MTEQEALEALKKILPHPLSFLQEAILLGTWSGRIYRDIASECGYEIDYVRAVGAELWEELSQVLDQRITKKNIRLVLEKGLWSVGMAEMAGDQQAGAQPLYVPQFPGGLMPLCSPFYIDRPEETIARAEVSKPGSLIRIEAPQQIGKSSLAYRVLAHANRLGYRTFLLNLQMADRSLLQNLNQFLRWFCSTLALQLNLDPCLDRYWQDEMGSKMSFKIYLRDYLLAAVHQPIVLALDDIQLLFQEPTLCREFLSMLRSIHEETLENTAWAKLRLIVVRSTEVPVPLSMEPSLFKVGLPIYPSELTLEQIRELAQRYALLAEDSDMNQSVLEMLLYLVGGHPYLIQLAFYQFKYCGLSLHQFMQQATTQAGIYRHHLRSLLGALLAQPALKQAYQQVVNSQNGMQLDAITAYRLEGLGLIKLQGDLAVPRCKLYSQYFSQQLATIGS